MYVPTVRRTCGMRTGGRIIVSRLDGSRHIPNTGVTSSYLNTQQSAGTCVEDKRRPLLRARRLYTPNCGNLPFTTSDDQDRVAT